MGFLYKISGMITKRQLKNPQMFGKELGNTQFCTVYKPLFKAWCESEHVIMLAYCKHIKESRQADLDDEITDQSTKMWSSCIRI